MNLLYFCSVFFFIGYGKSAWGERFIASITAFTESSRFCVAHTFTFEKCAIQIGPTGKRTPHQPKCQLYLSSVELENSSNVIGCDGDGGQSKCSGCAPLVGTVLWVFTKYINVHINLADLKIFLSVGFEWTKERYIFHVLLFLRFKALL